MRQETGVKATCKVPLKRKGHQGEAATHWPQVCTRRPPCYTLESPVAGPTVTQPCPLTGHGELCGAQVRRRGGRQRETPPTNALPLHPLSLKVEVMLRARTVWAPEELSFGSSCSSRGWESQLPTFGDLGGAWLSPSAGETKSF